LCLDAADEYCVHSSRESAALTREQRLELVATWMQSGFRQYADQCGYWKGEIQTNIRIQIDKYAEEFGRILHGEVEMSDEDDPQTLRTDLYGLKKSGCPASGLVELMLASTSDFGVTISDLLFRAKILDEHLISHKNLGFPTELKKPGCSASGLAEAILASDFVVEMRRWLFQAGILDDDFFP